MADKISLGYTHLSGCTGCTVALADNYAGLLTLLDKYVDLKYMPTLADARHVQKVDVSFVEGSVCINDKLAVQEIKETREKSAIVVALGGCACYGNITRFSRGGQQNQPAHEAYLPIGDLIKVDIYIPGCGPSPQMIRNVCVAAYLLLKGNADQQALATAYLKPLMMLPERGTEAFHAARIAAELCGSLTENRARSADLWNEYQAKIRDAAANDGRQGRSQVTVAHSISDRRR